MPLLSRRLKCHHVRSSALLSLQWEWTLPSRGCPCGLDTGWRKDKNEDKTRRTGSWHRDATAKMWAGDKHPGSKLLRYDGSYTHSISWWKLPWICRAKSEGSLVSSFVGDWFFGLSTHRIFFFTFEIQKHYYATSSFKSFSLYFFSKAE